MCKYCQNEDYLVELLDISIVEKENGYWLSSLTTPFLRINFCPMCGRSLTPFNIIEQ